MQLNSLWIKSSVASKSASKHLFLGYHLFCWRCSIFPPLTTVFPQVCKHLFLGYHLFCWRCSIFPPLTTVFRQVCDKTFIQSGPANIYFFGVSLILLAMLHISSTNNCVSSGLRQDFRSVGAAGDPHAGPHGGEAVLLLLLHQGLHLQQATEGAHPHPHGGEALRLRHLRQNLRLQPRAQNAQDVALGRAALQVHPLRQVFLVKKSARLPHQRAFGRGE